MGKSKKLIIGGINLYTIKKGDVIYEESFGIQVKTIVSKDVIIDQDSDGNDVFKWEAIVDDSDQRVKYSINSAFTHYANTLISEAKFNYHYAIVNGVPSVYYDPTNDDIDRNPNGFEFLKNGQWEIGNIHELNAGIYREVRMKYIDNDDLVSLGFIYAGIDRYGMCIYKMKTTDETALPPQDTYYQLILQPQGGKYITYESSCHTSYNHDKVSMQIDVNNITELKNFFRYAQVPHK